MKDLELNDSLQRAIISFYSGSLTKEEAGELIAWLQEDARNRKYFREMGEIWHISGSLSTHQYDSSKALKLLKKKISRRDIRPVETRIFRVSYNLINRAAAVLLVLLLTGAGYIFFFRTNTATQAQSRYSAFIETVAPKGSKSFITLYDGTQIWLNADTRLRYPLDYGNKQRDVYLEGEAYFKVAKNKKVPFIVHTSGVNITALGTAFNVKSYNEESRIETTLEEGSVKIEANQSTDKAVQPILLKPGQSAIIQKTTGQVALNEKQKETDKADQSQPKSRKAERDFVPVLINVTKVSDTRLYTSWKDSKWVFRNEELGDLATKLERRYDVKITFADEDLKKYAFTGTLKDESLEQVLKVLSLTAPIRFEINHKDVVLFEDTQLKNKFQNLF